MAGFRVASKIKELRFLMCQTSKSSEGARFLPDAVCAKNRFVGYDAFFKMRSDFRNFIEEHYVCFKRANPELPILVRECSKIEPKLYVRAEYGKETCIPLANMSVNDIADQLKKATT